MKASTGRSGLASVVAFLAVVATGCSQFTIRADRNPDVDFARYRTFAWMPLAAAPPVDQDTGNRSLDNRVYLAVETELQRRGWVPAPADAADLLVTFRLVKRDGYDDEQIPYVAQWRRGAYRDALHASASSYDRGTLVIDAVDRGANALAWRGSASARLLPHTSYEAAVERTQAAVAKVLETFPAR